MKKKTKKIDTLTPIISVPFYKKYKESITIGLITVLISIFGIRMFYVHLKTQEAIAEYEAKMYKREYNPCAFVDEDNGSIESYTEKESAKDDNNRGIKSMHIPFIRGYVWSDGYGYSNCIPCKKSVEDGDVEAIRICNDKYGYSKLEYEVEDLDKIVVSSEPSKSSENKSY